MHVRDGWLFHHPHTNRREQLTGKHGCMTGWPFGHPSPLYTSWTCAPRDSPASWLGANSGKAVPSDLKQGIVSVAGCGVAGSLAAHTAGEGGHG